MGLLLHDSVPYMRKLPVFYSTNHIMKLTLLIDERYNLRLIVKLNFKLVLAVYAN